MRNRLFAGLLASTLALGLSLLASPTLHADGVLEPDPVVPEAPPAIDAPEPPVLDDELGHEVVYERPELAPVRLAAPSVEASPHC